MDKKTVQYCTMCSSISATGVINEKLSDGWLFYKSIVCSVYDRIILIFQKEEIITREDTGPK